MTGERQAMTPERIAELRALNPWTDVNWPEKCRAAADTIEAQAAELERLRAGLREALSFAKAHEAWEGDVILNGDWGEHGMCSTPKLTEAQWDQVVPLQDQRNALLTCIRALLPEDERTRA